MGYYIVTERSKLAIAEVTAIINIRGVGNRHNGNKCGWKQVLSMVRVIYCKGYLLLRLSIVKVNYCIGFLL